MVKFYSNKLEKEVSAKVLDKRKTTVKLLLEDGNVIVKKIKQVTGL